MASGRSERQPGPDLWFILEKKNHPGAPQRSAYFLWGRQEADDSSRPSATHINLNVYHPVQKLATFSSLNSPQTSPGLLPRRRRIVATVARRHGVDGTHFNIVSWQ